MMVGPRGWGVGPGGGGVSGTWSVLIYTGVGEAFQILCLPRGLTPLLFWRLLTQA